MITRIIRHVMCLIRHGHLRWHLSGIIREVKGGAL